MSRALRIVCLFLALPAIGLFAHNTPPTRPPAGGKDDAPRAVRGIPMQLNHQGVVLVVGQRFNGNGFFRFALVDSSTGINAWTNDGTHVGTTGTPDAAVGLVVINGIYNVALGDTSQAVMVPLTASAFNLDNLVLRIWFDDGVSGIQLLSPDQKLTSTPYAFRAASADTAVGVVPIGAIVAWTNHLAGTPALPDTFVQCNGQVLSDPQSPLNGQTIPNLNNTPAGGYTGGGRFLRGGTTSGNCQDATAVYNDWDVPGSGGVAVPWGANEGMLTPDGTTVGNRNVERVQYIDLVGNTSTDFAYSRPVNMSVIWIMRVK